jgi:hypothetical protein
MAMIRILNDNSPMPPGKELTEYCFVGTDRATGVREMINGPAQSLVACEAVSPYMQETYKKQYKRIRIAKHPYKSKIK